MRNCNCYKNDYYGEHYPRKRAAAVFFSRKIVYLDIDRAYVHASCLDIRTLIVINVSAMKSIRQENELLRFFENCSFKD